MTEWSVVTVLVTIVGLFVTVGGPVIKNTKAMTELTVNIKNLTANQLEMASELKELRKENVEAHRRLWDKNDEQDKKLYGLEKDLEAFAPE